MDGVHRQNRDGAIRKKLAVLCGSTTGSVNGQPQEIRRHESYPTMRKSEYVFK